MKPIATFALKFFWCIISYQGKKCNKSPLYWRVAKYLIHIIIQCLFLIILFLTFLEIGVQEKYIFIAHLKHFVCMLYFLIFLPKYYIHQNPSLKLYVKYYHYQPAPILPWQVPNNFDPDSVKLNVITLELVRPSEPVQPDPTQPEFGPQGPNPTQLNPNLDPGSPTQPEIGFKLGSFGFIKYIAGLNPNPIWGQPEFWVRKRVQLEKNGLGLAALVGID